MAQFSFRKTLFSKLALVLLRFRAVKSPQTENNLSTYAWEAGAATRSRANPPMYLYWDYFTTSVAMRGSFVHIRTFLVYKKLKTKIKTKKINIQIRFRLCNSNFILVFWHFVIVIIILIN